MFDRDGLYLEVSPRGGKWWRLKYRTVLLQIADTSLSCPHSNNDPTTDLGSKSLLISDPSIRTYTLRELLIVWGESFAVFFRETRPGSARRTGLFDRIQRAICNATSGPIV